MTSRLMAIMVLVAAAFLAVPSSAQTNCGVYASCGTCTPVGGCGWCTYSGTCEAGNQTGSFVGCTGQYWVWTAQYCPATPAPTPVSCSALTTCNSCTAQGSCGWCAFVGQCQRGNQSGSVEGCTGQYWDWTSAQCSTPTPATPAPISCSAYTCLSCTQLATCGWCASTATCQAGNSIGPFNATCLNWDWTSNLCSTPTPATPAPISCSAYTCLSCTQLASCGWCASTATCQSGTSTGPYNATCLNWDWTTNQCSTPAPPTPTAVSTCQNAYSCAQCTQLASCGWCASTLTCLNGTNVGPFNGTCLNWDWQNSQCGQQDAAKTAKLH